MARQKRMRARKVPLGAIAAVVGGALLVGLAVVAPGFDAQQTPLDDGTVWAIQNGQGLRYARINAELGEIDTVKHADNPTAIVQTQNDLLLYTQGNSKVTDVSLSQPVDIDDSTEGVQDTPSGTNLVRSAGDYIGYLTDSGGVYAARASGGAAALPVVSARSTEEGADAYVSSAIAVSPDGILYSYSEADSAVLRYNIRSDEVIGEDAVANGPTGGSFITAVGGTWVILDGNGSTAWIRGLNEPVTLDVTGRAVLQQPSSSGAAVLVAHQAGLLSVQLSDGASSVLQGGATLGEPAAPVVVGATAYAAWLPESEGPGTLWSSSAGTTPLDYGGEPLEGDRAPTFQTNGSRVILNEEHSGWVWTVPSGALVASSQNWGLDDTAEQEQQDDQQEPPRVIDPKPPVAADDQFGVRSGAIATLPVLLNDSDPNEDVLTIVPESVSALDPAFGTLSVTNNQQQFSVSIAPGASGSASFTYQVTDGSSANGLNSGSATVSLSVIANEVNSAPVWCGVSACLAEWPSPQVIPGGTVSADALHGWVDPEGDPIFVAAVENPDGVGTAVATADGRVVFQHPDPNSVDAATVPINVVVSDVKGATAAQIMNFRVTATPNLTAEDFAVVAELGEPVLVDPRDHVSGMSGALTLTAAKSLVTEGTSFALNPSEATFTFQATQPGSYIIDYTVADSVAEQTGMVRVTLLPTGSDQLTTAPVLAFVRPKEDATIDVFTAVSNPAGRVLLLSGVVATADPHATLAVDVVGQSLLRVSGSTDTGQAGLLGTVTYTVSDGTGSSTASAQGMATVYLLDTSSPSPPVAADDAVTVRAGDQVDIPVLDNDVTSEGSSIGLDPSSLQYSADVGLAFASGRLVRYLAPETPGVYELFYTAYTAGHPELTDSAKVTLTVTSPDANTAPQPRALTGRVVSGQSVSMRFDPRGVDPDGDAVILDRILTQPESGTAAISADGTSIVYTSVAGYRGQVRFNFQVKDARGEVGTAIARVGVLDEQSDPRPITYSDYAQARMGSDSTIVIDPTLNDLDPRGGSLELLSVVPDAQPDTDEYRYLESLISSVDGNVVSFTAGETLGSMSFIYSVANASGDTAQGFIVLTVVREAIADYPTVSDTILTAATRDSFAQGADVVTGKVVWNSGDYRGLKLSLWQTIPGITVDGWTIKGALPQETLLIPFALTGPNYAGDEVTSYGFLKVLGEDELRLALIDPTKAQEVDEKGQVSFDLSKLVEYSASDTLEVDAEGVAASGRRAAASCELESGTTVTYVAGTEAPWDDSCTIPVKMSRQEFFTYVTVQIRVIAEDPQPELRSGSLTVSPGATATYDLTQMTSFQGRGDLATVEYAVSYTGTQFKVTSSGQTVTIVGQDAARTGTEERISVSITNYDGVTPAALVLQVGLAPSTLPKGASVVQQCSQSSGSSCAISVIGGLGEVNPLPGTPLTLVSVESPTTCPGVTFAAGGGGVVASWSTDAAGASCSASFVVQDAQGRQSSGDRNGTVTLDLQGYPKAPNSVSQVAYSADSVTLRVDPGAASSAYPALTGFVVSGGGQSVNCTPAGECGTISGLTNGQQIVFTANAQNSVGDSLGSVQTTAWAYRPPVAPTVTAVLAYSGSLTTDTQGAVSVTIATTDDGQATASYLINGAPTTRTAGASMTVLVGAPVGPQTISVQAVSVFQLPSGTGPSGSSSTGVSNSLVVAGKPSVTSLSASSSGDGNVEAVASVGLNYSTDAPTVIYVASSTSSNAPTCSVDLNGELTGASVPGGTTSTTGAFTGLNPRKEYTITACVGNGYGAAASGGVSQVPWGAGPGAPVGAFTIDLLTASTDSIEWQVVDDGYGIPAIAGYTVQIDRGSTGWNVDPQITAKYCLDSKPSLCGPTVTLSPSDPARPLPEMISELTATATCSDSAGLSWGLVSGASTGPAATFTTRSWTLTNASGAQATWAPEAAVTLPDHPWALLQQVVDVSLPGYPTATVTFDTTCSP